MSAQSKAWFILKNSKRKALVEISTKKIFGKFSVYGEMIRYGKQRRGEYFFQSDNKESRIWGFRNQSAVSREKGSYKLCRQHSLSVYSGTVSSLFFLLSFFSFFLASSEPKSREIESEPSEVVPVVEKKVNTARVSRAKYKKSDSTQKKFEESFLKAKKDFQYGRLMEARRVVRKYMDQFQPSTRKDAKIMLGEIEYLICKDKLRKREERKAVIHCEKAVEASNHTKSKIFLESQEKKAKRIFLEGYTLQALHPETAQKKYMEVLQSAKSKSTWRNKAQYRLRKIKKSKNR